jgi:hypothetical protein
VGLPKDNLTHPVLISFGKSGGGSGFYLHTEQAVYLVTACHVLFKDGLDLFPGIATLASLASDFVSKVVLELDCAKLQADGALRKHATADVAVCKLGTFSSAVKAGVNMFPGVTGKALPPAGALVSGLSTDDTSKLQDVTVSNDLFLFGYPTSLAKTAQIDRASPLLRKGIVAGKTEDRRLVIDCPVYFGNSGGLVMEVSDGPSGPIYRGIGIATEMIPFTDELWSKQFNKKIGVRYENSGYAIVEPMDRILELL